MKICIFSDIHGNGVAFEAAYKKIIDENAELNIFLGDLCGYYFDEIEIYEKLLEMPHLVVLRGNHDNMFISAVEGDQDIRSKYLLKYGLALENFLRKDHKPMIEWLKGKSESFLSEEFNLACYHGSPTNQAEGYLYPDSDLKEISKERHLNILLGHTHYSMHRVMGEKIVVNPGSLGQPRQAGWPTYAVLTLPQRKVEFREVPYDVNKMVKILEQKGEKNPYLKEVLLRHYVSDKK